MGFRALVLSEMKGENRLLTGEIYSIYVLEDFWNLGIGRTLMENSLAALERDGFGSVKVWVLETNQESHILLREVRIQNRRFEKD